eukprot:Hpha_TRINITY_DN13566_c0_g1::TRINITY_DN13566_c0_g1_i1::g.111220::m.111220
MGDGPGITLSFGGDAGVGEVISDTTDKKAEDRPGGLGGKWGRIATGGMPGRTPHDTPAADTTEEGHLYPSPLPATHQCHMSLYVPQRQKPGGMQRKKSSFLITAELLASRGKEVTGLPPEQVIHGEDEEGEEEEDLDNLEQVFAVLCGGDAGGLLPTSLLGDFLTSVGADSAAVQKYLSDLTETVELEAFEKAVYQLAL